MVRIVLLAAQSIVLAYLVYELAVSSWGWRHPVPPARSAPAIRFRITIPAHNEAAVILGLVADLGAQDYPSDRIATVVIADRCDDDTAAVAEVGAQVVERASGEPGKGAALDWYLASAPLEPDEALVVFDADTRLPPDALSRIADEFALGHSVCQLYLDVENPSGSWLSMASALSYWAGNRMVQLARHNLGWSADLGGTGMAFTESALADLGSFGSSVTEDQAALAKLTVAGHRVRWLHDVRLRDEKPDQVGAAVVQRARWVAGKRQAVRRYAGRLLSAAWRERSWAPVDVMLRLIQPGRSFLALVAGVLAVVALLTSSDLLFAWWVWAAAAGVLVLAPVAFLIRDGVAKSYVVRYPVLALMAVLWLPIRIVSRLSGTRWRRTPRRAERA